jgi:chorismate mutase-like protein
LLALTDRSTRRQGRLAQAAIVLLAIALGALVLVQRSELQEARAQLARLQEGDTWPDARVAHGDADAVLIARVMERLELMHDVARWKWNAQKPIDDPDRETALLARVVIQATNRGIDADEARAFFQDQFAAAKILQRADFDQWNREGQGPFEDVPDLATVQRPRIDAATEKLLDALVALREADRRPQFSSTERLSRQRKRMTAAASSRFDSPADPVRRALRSIVPAR